MTFILLKATAKIMKPCGQYFIKNGVINKDFLN